MLGQATERGEWQLREEPIPTAKTHVNVFLLGASTHPPATALQKAPSWGAPRTCPSHPGGTAQEDNTPEPSSQGKGCGVWDHQAEPHLTRLVIPADTSHISGSSGLPS